MSEEDQERPRPESARSRSEARREALGVSALAGRLVGLRDEELARVPLPEPLREAVQTCRGLRKGARTRQLRRVAKLLREGDPEPVVAALEGSSRLRDGETLAQRAASVWCDRLVAGGDAALQDFVEAHAEVDRSRLRQLVRNVSREAEESRRERARRALLRAVSSAARREE